MGSKDFSDLEMRVQILEHRHNNRPCMKVKRFFCQLWQNMQGYQEGSACCTPGLACGTRMDHASDATVVHPEPKQDAPSKQDVVSDMITTLQDVVKKEGGDPTSTPISVLMAEGITELKITKLIEGGIDTVEALELISADQLASFNGIGKSSTAKIILALAAYKK